MKVVNSKYVSTIIVNDILSYLNDNPNEKINLCTVHADSLLIKDSIVKKYKGSDDVSNRIVVSEFYIDGLMNFVYLYHFYDFTMVKVNKDYNYYSSMLLDDHIVNNTFKKINRIEKINNILCL